MEAPRHHADHLVIPAVQHKLLSESIRGRAEVALRETVAEDDHGVPAGLALGFGEGAANSGLGAEDGKEIRVGDGT